MKLEHTSHKSIAVLPFVNMSTDPDNEYFSDGITEEIINALTKIRGLKVIARTSSFAFKNTNIDIRTIAEKLGVTTILEGSVRKVQNRVRITAQLINAEDGVHFWSKNYDREMEDIFALQDEISELIADQIRENYGHLEIPASLHHIPTKNIEAYELVLKGNYYLKRKDFSDIKRALHLFTNATQLAPTYSEAYSALGEAYLHAAGFGMLSTTEAHKRARQAAEKAIELNSKNAQGHKVLAYVKLFYDWDWEAALEAYNNAVQSGLPNQNEFITYYYIFIEEDFERAIQVTEQIIETDPIHAISHWQLGLTYYFCRKFEQAITAFSAALEIDPQFGEALRFRGLVWGYLGKYKEAFADINQALELTNGQGIANLDMLVVKILMGKKTEVYNTVKETEYIDSSDPAFLYSLLDKSEEAIYWLEKAYEERSVMMVTLKNFWVWDNLRKLPSFKVIYDKMHFPPSTKDTSALSPVNIKPISNSLLREEDVPTYLNQLDYLITEDKIHEDPALSLRLLADKMKLHPNKLSWLLNEHIGKNFNEYVNAFRLEAFKQKALDPGNSHLTLLGLAYESGFNSKTVFNAFFKKTEGTTPSNWVKKQTS
ncbi:MAG: helix-turn-helix domain-containing protein [Chitinophagales bacterium]|nr:helix-turn-helix domain-containing protein [Chitinophagales bacterium]